jgi:hypothetical protein
LLARWQMTWPSLFARPSAEESVEVP